MGRVSPRLLLVEDDDHIRMPLRWALEDEGYEVAEAASGEDACRQVAIAAPDLMIVDLMLGAMDGYAVIREVRRANDLPIVVVSARADTHDIVAALEAGADDYVTKPFQVKEITARLRALRRRIGASSGADERPQELVLDNDPAAPLVLRPDRGTVHRGTEQLHLTLTEFRLLCELAASPGRVLSRQALLERVWEHGFFGDERLVDVHVRRLRTKVERDPGAPTLVVTVRGLGYRLDPQ
ncbi:MULTISPECIES: response regulator transcription factor [unclassified Modestobacter]|uniref:response regulator transcription factor n=1 Tax=unclassified Modestobacter TaxID=2643866 RepID=UPI0022AA7E45|nr:MULTISPECIES: response regulator transcription factor [unclassified Modestobacter]MCZ2811575.1 response regulator transcription factor [Modestobacter sp. VKM Ac-2979]MCZ2843298.1 response regulator transcription factor [Modestobacter sp. VKM Ac-2980]MCZ2848739.1 response regulator transcription factor [Modestobacter sp. VKM Ac-2978]